MSSFRLASRYSKSLLQLAQEKGQLEAVKTDMSLISNTLKSSRDLHIMLQSPIIPSDKKEAILAKLFGSNVNDLTNKFIVLLTKKGRESFLGEVANTFISQYDLLNNITNVKLTTATTVDQATVDNIINKLKAKENIKEIKLVHEVDASLIGGFVLTYGDKQIDTSARKSLNRLKTLVDDDSYVKAYF